MRDDLLTKSAHEITTGQWQRRQAECESWYQELIRSPAGAGSCLRLDYELLARALRSMRGDVLDVGGGAGITRHYLPECRRYVSVDPSDSWLHPEWQRLAGYFPDTSQPLRFVRAVAEALPFDDAQFDAVLFIWSLNHVSDPAVAIAEAARVLRTGGRAFLVLEDMPPRLTDFLGRDLWKLDRRITWRMLSTWVGNGLSGRPWPLQTDHCRIRESDIHRWAEGRFELKSRKWRGHYLTFLLRRLQTTADE